MLEVEKYDTILGFEVVYNRSTDKYGVKLPGKIKWFSSSKRAKEFIYKYLR